jgi:DNA-directed RNA polymerase subunit RPC12/RpoP
MINIVKPGYLKETQCPKCGAVLSYDENEDVQKDFSKELSKFSSEFFNRMRLYIVCPQCGNKIILKADKLVEIELGGYCE